MTPVVVVTPLNVCKNVYSTFLFFVSVRSKIQGLGLYAARDLEKGQMIIEYIGEVIRYLCGNFSMLLTTKYIYI
jgi:hypothetical protein